MKRVTLSVVVICLHVFVETCPHLDLNEVIHATCKNKESENISCAEATDYATLTYACPGGYKIPDGVNNTIQCLNGSWEFPTPECQLVNVYEQPQVPPMKVVCFYDGRRYSSGAKPKDFNASLCTHIIYHYVGLSYNGNIIDSHSNFDVDEEDLYESVVAMKNQSNDLKVLLSVYGLGIHSTDEFPVVSKDSVKRAKFVSSAVSLLEKYNFDGLDIHWHSPSSADKYNYIAILREVKEELKRLGKLLTVTVYYTSMFLGYNTNTLNAIVDWVNVKCYDFYNEFDQYTGQHSGLYPSSLDNDFQENNFNVANCAENWRHVGIRPQLIVPVITFFGRYYTLRNSTQHGLHAPVTGSTNSNHTGLVSYDEICEKYANWTKVWDKQQKNPYRYHQDKWVGYDDEKSIRLKAAYIKEHEYSGIGIFSIDADDVHGKCGTKQALLQQVHAGLDDDDDDDEK